jgi:glycosyltransferase involved in cell wall biosynthesis
MAKRALIFSLVYYPDFIGGAEVAVKEITDRIDAADIEFHMITIRGKGGFLREEKVGNIIVHRIGFARNSGVLHTLNKYFFPFLAARLAARLHTQKKFDMTWSIMANLAGFAALFFKLFHMDVPFVLTLQEGDPIDYILKKTRFVSKPFKMIFTHADRIQAISKYLADFGKAMGATCEAVVVPNGVDTDRFSKATPGPELDALKKEIGKMADDVFLVTASRLVAKNAVGDIISALSYLPANVKLLVLGVGALESALKLQVRKADLEDRVIFKGYVSHESMPAYFQACDIFIRPSLSEGFGNSFIEAMAAGLPVIATPVGGIVDFLKNKETGIFCEVKSPQDIARKVEVYMRDRNLRDEIVDNAMHMVLDHYDWKIIAKDMQEKVLLAL